jgi:hypothetical protein
MAQVVDVRSSGGEFIILGGALALPSSANPVSSPVAGSIRYDPPTASLQIFNGFVWAQATGSGSGVTSFNARTGAVTLTASDVSTALGFMPLGNAVTIAFSQLPTSLNNLPLIYTYPGLQPPNQQVWTIPITVPFMLPLNALGSIAYASNAANATALFTLGYVRGTTKTVLGTITFPSGALHAIFSTLAYTASIGDILVLFSPVTQNPTLANVGIGLLGTRTD